MCQRYLREWRHLRPSLNGHDVERLAGIRGPGVGAALRRLRHARLSGEVKGRREEIALLLREFGGVPGTRA